MNNSYGDLFRFTTWGESHGKAIGCVIDGVPAGIEISEEYIQYYVNKRRPNSSEYVTERNEKDKVEILSGVFNGYTTGAPISVIIFNHNHKSEDYDNIKDKFRPGHADYTYYKKYGHYDYRGGGRASARETAMRVVAGAVARKIIDKFSNIKILGYLTQIGPYQINNFEEDYISENELFCPDRYTTQKWQEYINNIRNKGDSVAANIGIIVKNMPIGIGEPVYNKLDSRLAEAIMSINAVKSFEIGAGTEHINLLGSESNDSMTAANKFLSNNSGGILGGISNGNDLIIKFTVKAPSSIAIEQNTIDRDSHDVKIKVKGRHDPCVGIRAVPVGEAMVACVLADLLLIKNSSYFKN